MEEAALQDYRDKDVHSSRDFTAKVGSPSFIHANQHLFQFETFLFSAAVQWREASRHRGCGGQARTSAEPVC